MDRSYKNLSEYLGGLFRYDGWIYPASYGIGIDNMFAPKTLVESVRDKLEGLGVEFRTEVSEGRSVYRFIISRCRKNIDILSAITK